VPEGDSYTRAADRIRSTLLGRTVEVVDGSSPSVRRASGRLTGDVVETIRTRGKHLLIDMASGLTIHVHLGMPGRVRVTRGTRLPAQERGGARLALTTAAGTVWVLAAPTVEVERRAVVDAGLARLGPDVLADMFDWEGFEERAGRYPPDRTVADFLLDQRVMAGVGNEYKCEILFLEGVAPGRSMDTVDAASRTALAGRARRIMLPNAHRGRRSTTGRPGADSWVYGRAGLPCRRCRSPIEEGWVGDPPRITYWCPHCQA
jgi:endonuclease VIII